MKPSNKLMRDFAKVVLPSGLANEQYPWIVGVGSKGYMLNDLQTVIELAQKWSDNILDMQAFEDGGWRVFISFSPPVDHKNLKIAIMRAVVNAEKSEKNNAR